MHSGTMIKDLVIAADRVQSPPQNPIDAVRSSGEGDQLLTGEERWKLHARWPEIYFETGELILPAWELVIRIREGLCRGAKGDGVMSPGAAEAWFNLAPLQDELVMGE
jgi:hypothetical protein